MGQQQNFKHSLNWQIFLCGLLLLTLEQSSFFLWKTLLVFLNGAHLNQDHDFLLLCRKTWSLPPFSIHNFNSGLSVEEAVVKNKTFIHGEIKAFVKCPVFRRPLHCLWACSKIWVCFFFCVFGLAFAWVVCLCSSVAFFPSTSSVCSNVYCPTATWEESHRCTNKAEEWFFLNFILELCLLHPITTGSASTDRCNPECRRREEVGLGDGWL